MNKKDMLRIQALAGRLMRLDRQIWDRHGWSHGGMVVDDVFKHELKDGLAKLKIVKIDGVIYHILEDANFHTSTKALEELGVFDKSYEDSQKDFDAYLGLKGKTWQL